MHTHKFFKYATFRYNFCKKVHNIILCNATNQYSMHTVLSLTSAHPLISAPPPQNEFIYLTTSTSLNRNLFADAPSGRGLYMMARER